MMRSYKYRFGFYKEVKEVGAKKMMGKKVGHSMTDHHTLHHHVTDFVHFWPKGSSCGVTLKSKNF